MQAIIRRSSFLIYFLIFHFVGLPGPLWAKENESRPSDHSSERALKIKIAVVELHDDKVKPELVEKVADVLRDEMSHKARFEVVSKEMTKQFFETSPKLLQRIDASNPLNRYLDQAKEFYKTFQFKEAIGVLSNTIQTYRNSTATLTDHFLLTDAYLMLGNVHMGNNDVRHAQEAFKEAVRLDPVREIDEMQYPPKTVNMFKQSKEEYLKKAKSISLQIQSSPSKAEVYINGDFKGQTPLTLNRFTTGEHFLLIKHEGFKPKTTRLQLKSNDSLEKFVLEKSSERFAYGNGLTVSNLGDVSEQVRLASAVGKAMGVDKIVLVSLEEVGWNNKITARMIDIKYQASHKPKSVEVLDLARDTHSASSVISADLNNIADVDLAKDPKRYADSDVVVIGSKKKKSFLKSPILWSLVGVLVAGGAASALLIGGGGGGGGGNTSAVSLSGAVSRTP